jgi:hypothetical protein
MKGILVRVWSSWQRVCMLKPATIFILGNSSKSAVEEFCEFEDLKKHEVRDDYDKKVAGYRVILCPYPGAQTRTCMNEIIRSFSKIRARRRNQNEA